MGDRFAVIREHCSVIAETENAIFYMDDGYLCADINDIPFYCTSVEEFYEMVELVGDKTFED